MLVLNFADSKLIKLSFAGMNQDMVRNYKKIISKRQKCNYSTEFLRKTVQHVVGGKKSLRDAEKQYGVPRNTISNHIKAGEKMKL